MHQLVDESDRLLFPDEEPVSHRIYRVEGSEPGGYVLYDFDTGEPADQAPCYR